MIGQPDGKLEDEDMETVPTKMHIAQRQEDLAGPG
jgi:hypothetical protein